MLDEIRSLVPESYFEGKYVDILHYFLINTLGNEDLPDDYYTDIIEYIIETCTSRGGRYAGITSTPTEVASLMAFLTNVQNPKMIFDPCAGLSSYAILPELKEIPFTGYELDLFTSVLAKIRLDAFGKNGNIIRTNALSDWNLDKNCDTLVSEPPFGIKINYKENGNLISPFMEDYIIYKFINTPSIRKAVLLVSSVSFARKENHHLRELISNNNWIDSVIKLPTGILPYTSVATGVLVLNKDKKSSDVKFILADDCIKSLIYKSKKLDTKSDNEKNADQFASYFIAPYKSLRNRITHGFPVSMADVIALEQYYGMSHMAMLWRLVSEHYLTTDELEDLSKGVMSIARNLGYDDKLYKPLPLDSQKRTYGFYLKQIEQLREKDLVSPGKIDELLIDAFREDIAFDIGDDQEGEAVD